MTPLWFILLVGAGTTARGLCWMHPKGVAPQPYPRNRDTGNFVRIVAHIDDKNPLSRGESLARLSATSVEITASRRTYFGSLIDGGVRDEDRCGSG